MESVPFDHKFTKGEEEVLDFWNQNNVFELSLERNAQNPRFSFADGPPFATGTPHHGHLLVSTVKDVYCRYKSMNGFYVPRNWGWDTHGLPIEHLADKELGIECGAVDIPKLEEGIKTYNEKCKSMVMRYSKEWRYVISRLGRWVDFDNDYRTLYPWYMESVWWVFGQLWKKGLVYKGTKVMPWSTALGTCLSNFEANQNYADVEDPAVHITFPIVGDEECCFIAWTTTPWTLPSNLALIVNPGLEYVEVTHVETERRFIVMKELADSVWPQTAKQRKKKKPKPYVINRTMLGSELVGMQYVPLFDYFYERKKDTAFRVIADTYVTTESGTGVVHAAPGFGEDDLRVCLAFDIVDKHEDPVCPIDPAGCFTPEVTNYEGMYVKDADALIIEELKDRDRLYKQSVHKHRYPLCWRSDTPLLYRSVPSWFVAVEKIKDDMIANNRKNRWVPEVIQTGRFHNWISNARDWAISRNRFFGTPIPIWQDEDGDIIVIDSLDKLEELSGQRPTDLHNDVVDEITFPNPKTGKEMRRIPEIFDCWFESGSMPYASHGYPFKTPDFDDLHFPIDFCSESLDQTRGWFYTMLVLSTALFNEPPFKNLIVTGLILAEDGQKMSKSKKNYTDPMELINKMGSDALRLYLINSPVLKAEPFCFSDEGVLNVVIKILNPWFNSYKFLVQNVHRYEVGVGHAFVPDQEKALQSPNALDQWILGTLSNLIKFTAQEMENYRLYTVVPKMLGFLNSLTNWYIRMNRSRFKEVETDPEKAETALQVLFFVEMTFNTMMAPFTPFFTENLWLNMRKQLPENHPNKEDISVHLVPYPAPFVVDDELVSVVDEVFFTIQLLREVRECNKLSIRRPIKSATIVHRDQNVINAIKQLDEYIKLEVNIMELKYDNDPSTYARTVITPDFKQLGRKMGKKLKPFSAHLKNMTEADVAALEEAGQLVFDGTTVLLSELVLELEFIVEDPNVKGSSRKGFLALLDSELTNEVLMNWQTRNLTSFIQKMRAAAQLQFSDVIDIHIVKQGEFVPVKGLENDIVPEFADTLFEAQKNNLEKALRARVVYAEPEGEITYEDEMNFVGYTLVVKIIKQ
ncbi:hypothetical protein PCE1_004966 [Barthelona sp. PCE]